MKAAGKSRLPSMVCSTWDILHEENPTADSPSRLPAVRSRCGNAPAKSALCCAGIAALLCVEDGLFVFFN